MTQNENVDIEQEILNAIDEGIEPTKEVEMYLHEFFDNFSSGLQNKLIELGYVVKQKCHVYSRVMGYIQTTENFNIGKKQEFAERKYLQPYKIVSGLKNKINGVNK